MKNPKYTGAALVLVIIVLAVMAILVVSLNQVIISQQRSVSNANDLELAQNYARIAMLDAESKVNAFDQNSGMETSSGQPESSNYAKWRYDNIIGKSGGSFNIVTAGATCNATLGTPRQGWCYQAADTVSYNSNQSFTPWEVTNPAAVKPCNSYNQSGDVPLIDDATSRYSIQVNLGDSQVCANPRYLLEPINLDFRGMVSNRTSSNLTFSINQVSNQDITSFKVTNGNFIQSARLYRITVRAFGRNGNTRVTFQEYVAVVGQTQNREIGDSINTVPHQLIVISQRFLR
jgi:Tfp pilus assembly protein PilX